MDMKIPLFSKKTSCESEWVNRSPVPRHTDFSLTSHFAESFNRLRINLGFVSRFSAPVKVIQITGATPGEGKTTVAVNLAESLAFAGQRVLLIECDLRLPNFKDLFPTDPGKGLSSLICETFHSPVQKGRLGTLTLGDLMTLIDLQQKTGVLTIANNNDAFRFSFEKGRLVLSIRENRPEEKRLALSLISSGKITEEQAEVAQNRARQTGHELGFILLNMGVVSPGDLRHHIRLQLIETLGQAFTLSEAEYDFDETSHLTSKRETIDPIRLETIRAGELPGLNIRSFLKEQVASSIIETDIRNLHVLPAGPLPPNPSEMLGSRRMATLMSMLKDTFDYEVLIMDSPPVTAVSDASILSAFADGVIIVVCAGAVNRAIIHRAVDQLKQVNAPILGFVLNRMDPNEDKYYYGYYYKYKDYYKGKGAEAEAGSREKGGGSRQCRR